MWFFFFFQPPYFGRWLISLCKRHRMGNLALRPRNLKRDKSNTEGGKEGERRLGGMMREVVESAPGLSEKVTLGGW